MTTEILLDHLTKQLRMPTIASNIVLLQEKQKKEICNTKNIYWHYLK
ncbi:hypothetical protein [Heyndrickxia sporothermodurans]